MLTVEDPVSGVLTLGIQQLLIYSGKLMVYAKMLCWHAELFDMYYIQYCV